MTAMDQLFSRASVTPPPPPPPPPPVTHSTSPSHIDALFQSIQIPPSNPQGNNSAPATPALPAFDPASTPSSHPLPPSSAADRQSALLSLLYPAATSVPAHASLIPQPSQQQIPTPPASSSQRSGQSPSNNSETQGKILLEQLMAG